MPEDRDTMMLRVPRKLWFRIRSLAQYEHRTIQGQATWLLEKALADTFVPDDVTQETPA